MSHLFRYDGNLPCIMLRQVVLFFLMISGFGFLQAEPAESFAQAKKQLQKIYSDHRITFYCGCHFDKHQQIRSKTCVFSPKEISKRDKRVEWEHIMPVHHFGKSRLCWQQKVCVNANGKRYKGRRCCAQQDKAFQIMLVDLHNLVPAIGSVNKARSNYPFEELYSQEEMPLHYFHGCPIVIEEGMRRVQPAEHHKGMIARAYLYMADRYQIPLIQSQRRIFERWHRDHPPTEWEEIRNQRIAKIQGNENHYVSKISKNGGIEVKLLGPVDI